MGVVVKCATRNDRYASFRKEDMAVGLELMLTAGLLFVVLTTDRALALTRANADLSDALSATRIDRDKIGALQSTVQSFSDKLTLSGWEICVLFLGLWSVSTVVRKLGWKSETEMNVFWGITVPLGLGILTLIAVMAGAVQ